MNDTGLAVNVEASCTGCEDCVEACLRKEIKVYQAGNTFSAAC